MRITHILASGLLSLALAACSGVEIRPAPVDNFAAGDYQYYRWRTQPLQNTANSSDPVYSMDPIMRREVNRGLQSKGYILDKERAQFSVDYLYATGMRDGAVSRETSNVVPYPTVVPNRQVNQAVVDNSIALGGVQETSNIALQFNDVADNKEVWHVIITKIVENVNRVDTAELNDNLKKAIGQALKPLPAAN
jgi:hypothetical protein